MEIDKFVVFGFACGFGIIFLCLTGWCVNRRCKHHKKNEPIQFRTAFINKTEV